MRGDYPGITGVIVVGVQISVVGVQIRVEGRVTVSVSVSFKFIPGFGLGVEGQVVGDVEGDMEGGCIMVVKRIVGGGIRGGGGIGDGGVCSVCGAIGWEQCSNNGVKGAIVVVGRVVMSGAEGAVVVVVVVAAE